MNTPALLLAMCILAVPVQGFTAPSSKRATPAPAEPITLNISDLYPGKAELLKIADQMTSDAEQMRDMEQYAREYERFRRALQLVKPGVSTWQEAERNKVQSVPRPTEEAQKAMENARKAAEQRVERRGRVAAIENAHAQQLKAQRDQLEAEQHRADQAAALKAAEIDAINRQTDVLEDSYWYGPYWYGPPAPTFTPAPPSPSHQPAMPPGPGILAR
jgi:hypothetical protein